MKISVVTPNYNGARCVERTIRSVLSQDYEDLEYIVVDDGSTDNSREIIRRYADKLTLIEKPNGGLPTAINAGFRRASGDLVYWLDSDDLLMPGTVRAAAELFARRSNASILYGNYYRIDDNDVPFAARKQPTYDRCIGLYGYLTVFHSFFNRRYLEQVGYADETIRCACDFDLYMRMVKLGPILHMGRYISAYRVHGRNMHQVQATEIHDEMWNVRRKYGKPGLSDAALRRLARWYQFRAVLRMLREGALFCRLRPFARFYVPARLPAEIYRFPQRPTK